jgi:hypothetical protein
VLDEIAFVVVERVVQGGGFGGFPFREIRSSTGFFTGRLIVESVMQVDPKSAVKLNVV